MIGNHDTKNVIMSNATLSGQHRTILIISLDCAALRPLTTMLESAGFDVQTAADRAAAETIIGRKLPDLILLDIKLLPTGGHEIRTQLTADEKTAHIPVLILGAAGDVDDGITEFLPAPIDCISNSFHGRNEARTNTTPPHQSDLDKADETEFQIKNQEVNRAGNGRQMLARALDKAVERIAIIAPDGRYLYVNEAGCRTMNYSRQEMLTLRVSDVDRRFSQDDWSAHFEELKKIGGKWLHTSVIDRTGGEHIFEVFSRYHKEGSDEFIWSCGWDVTEKEYTDKAVKYYQNILDNIGNPIALVDRGYCYKYINPAFQKVFGIPTEAIVGHSVAELLGVEVFEKTLKAHYDACFGGHGVNFQMWHEHRESGHRRFDIRYYPFFDSAGEISAVVSNITDITALYETQKALSDKEAQLQAFMENIPAAIYIKNERDEHIYVNEHAERFTGKTVAQLTGATTHYFFDDDTAKQLVDVDKKILAQELLGTAREWILARDGKKFFFRDYKFPITLTSGERLLGGIAFDITDIKEKEKHLQEAVEQINILKQRIEKENSRLRAEIAFQRQPRSIIGDSSAIRGCLADARTVAAENSTVLLQGETGTGKELFAQAIHDMSDRRHRMMVKVNCAALPANLIESELFGREKGAYTGAIAKQQGRFEHADGSTIFLD